MSQPLEPFAVPAEEACRLLGGISRSTLYRLALAGKLDRLDGGRTIITFASIARYTGADRERAQVARGGQNLMR